MVQCIVKRFCILNDRGRQIYLDGRDVLFLDFIDQAQVGQIITRPCVLVDKNGCENSQLDLEIIDPKVADVKIEIQKKLRRKNSDKKTGFRAKYTKARILTEVNNGK